MNHKSSITKEYKRIGNAAFLSRCNNVFTGIQGNPLFPQPPVKLEDFKLQVDQLEAAMVDAQHRDRLKAAQKNGVIAKLTEMLDQLADYVTTVANADEAILLASGFAVNAISVTPSFGPAEDFAVKIGPASGQVSVSVKRIPAATTYAVFYGIANNENTVWQHELKTISKFSLFGLQAGKSYVFKMKIIGTNDKAIETEIITKIVA
jgi:hypothetical protein